MNRSAFLGPVRLASHPRLASHVRLGSTQVMTDVDQGLIGTVQAAVVDFSMNGCAPCIQYRPVFDEVASQFGRDLLMASVNIDDSPIIAAQYGIRATPTTLFLSTGMEVNRIEGKMTREELIAQIASIFGISPSTQAQAPVQGPAVTPLVSPTAQQQAPYTPGAPSTQAASNRPSKALLVVGGIAIVGLVTGGLLAKG